jgi:Na+-translocating ferredoxin:NAD+ oxidoreductase RnfG subunit
MTAILARARARLTDSRAAGVLSGSAFVLSPKEDPDLGDHIGEEKQMTGSNAGQTVSEQKYVSVATFRKTGVASQRRPGSSRSTAAGPAY